MNSFLNRALDRWVIRMACRGMPQRGRHEPHAVEAKALLEAPDFFCDSAEIPSDFSLGNHGRFCFSSSIITPWNENNRVHGRLFPCAKRWQDFPTAILLHGWNDELGYRFRFPYMARLLNKKKMNAVVIALPYHLQRRPHGPDAITNFISEDLHRMVEATRQSIADTRSLVKWLHAQGSSRVGVWGSSLGAWLSGLLVCHTPELAFGVLTTPVAKLERVIMELAFCAPVRWSYQNNPIPLSRLNLSSHRPCIPLENILIHEAINDLFAPREAIEEFWESWGQPEIWRLRHGHISVLMSVPIMTRTVGWVAARCAKV